MAGEGDGGPASGGLRGSQPLKLGIFCLNVSSGTTLSEAASQDLTWDHNVEMAKAADRAGWDFLLPLGRWRGLEGKLNPNGSQFEPFTWAAGLGAVTRSVDVISTCHVPLMHPIMAAKQGATIDHISRGRFGMNIVAGWSHREFSMFGIEQNPHDERYDAADEWLTCIERLWTEAEDLHFEGSYYKVREGYLWPKPLRRPVIISAGTSPRGIRFALQRADFNFVAGHDLESLRINIERCDQIRGEVGGHGQILGHGPVVIGDTDAEAQSYFKWYVEQLGDHAAGRNLAEQLLNGGTHNLPDGGRVGGEQKPAIPEEVYQRLAKAFVAGWGGLPFVGTPERVAEALVEVHRLGVAGLALSWVNDLDGFSRFQEQVMPLLRQAGVRIDEPVAGDGLGAPASGDGLGAPAAELSPAAGGNGGSHGAR